MNVPLTVVRTRLRAGLIGATVASLAVLLSGGCGGESTPKAAAAPTPTATTAAPTLTATDMWVKTAQSGMTAAFGTLTNGTGADITVVTATSGAAKAVELHEVAMVDGQMVMRPKTGGFVIPAGGSHELKPGGDHLMLMGVTAPVRAGDEVTFTLTLAGGQAVQFTAVGKDFAGGKENYQPGAHGSPSPSMSMAG